MADSEKKTVQLSDQDFPENFPTSAKPVFRAVALLGVIVAFLCFIAYQCSEHPPENADEVVQPKVEKKIDLMDDEETDEE
ncbi:MAG TPA: hypothetical protein PLP17_01230 [Oligoflexia bacterium]|nr:hypothetical protein [Oligoflexia bacterium]